jgi:two-component system, NarL family, sensor kinase
MVRRGDGADHRAASKRPAEPMDIAQSVIDAPATPPIARTPSRAAEPSMVRLDVRGRILRASSSAAALLGFKPDELLGRPLNELAARDWRTAAGVALSRMQAGAGGPFELMLTGRTGRLTMVEMAVQPSADQTAEQAVTLTWTERRQRRLTTASGSADECELKRLADGVLGIFESESSRVASSLADEVASIITMARYVIEDAGHRLARGAVEETSKALRVAGEQLGEATARVMAMASELRPRLLDDLGLLPTLNWYCREFGRQHRDISVSQRITLSENDVPLTLRLTIFRIVQAGLANVARHAKASAARIVLTRIEDELRLVIEDNGVGFDVERWQQGRIGGDGCGLLVIRRWVESTGGECSFESTPRHGARVQAGWRLEPAGRPQDGPGRSARDQAAEREGAPE